MMLRLIRSLAAIAIAAVCLAVAGQPPATGEIEIPGWFKDSFLDLRADIAEATAAEKRLLLYFGQNGCPYCRELMQVNFSQQDIVDATRKHFDARSLSTSEVLPPWLVAGVRCFRCVSQAAELSALHSGARRADAKRGRRCGGVEVNLSKTIHQLARPALLAVVS